MTPGCSTMAQQADAPEGQAPDLAAPDEGQRLVAASASAQLAARIEVQTIVCIEAPQGDPTARAVPQLVQPVKLPVHEAARAAPASPGDGGGEPVEPFEQPFAGGCGAGLDHPLPGFAAVVQPKLVGELRR